MINAGFAVLGTMQAESQQYCALCSKLQAVQVWVSALTLHILQSGTNALEFRGVCVCVCGMPLLGCDGPWLPVFRTRLNVRFSLDSPIFNDPPKHLTRCKAQQAN